MDKGGKIEILEDGTWVYTNSEGITIKYIDGFPDFKNGIPPQVKKEFVIEGGFEGRSKDFSKAGDAGIGNTWHHTEVPGKMELVPYGIHNITLHNGGRSAGLWAYAPR